MNNIAVAQVGIKQWKKLDYITVPSKKDCITYASRDQQVSDLHQMLLHPMISNGLERDIHNGFSSIQGKRISELSPEERNTLNHLVGLYNHEMTQMAPGFPIDQWTQVLKDVMEKKAKAKTRVCLNGRELNNLLFRSLRPVFAAMS